VRLREERVRIAAEQRRLLGLVADPHREDVGARNARLLGSDPFEPDPHEALLLALVLDAEREAPALLARARQREGDPTHVLLVGHVHL
jgi:hypothetical protein